MTRTKLPLQARLIRAGIYALLVAMSYWVNHPFHSFRSRADILVDVGRYDVQLVPMRFDSHWSIYRTYVVRIRN
jgi:hypothetical protein